MVCCCWLLFPVVCCCLALFVIVVCCNSGQEGQPKEPHVLRGDSGKDPPPVKQKPRSQGIEVRDRWEGDPRESPGKGSWFVVVGCCFLLFVVVWCCCCWCCCWCCCCWCCCCYCCCSCCCSSCCCCSCCCCCCCCCYFCCCSSCSMLLLLLPLRQTCLLAAASPFLPSSSLTRSPLRRPGSADIYIYIHDIHVVRLLLRHDFRGGSGSSTLILWHMKMYNDV